MDCLCLWNALLLSSGIWCHQDKQKDHSWEKRVPCSCFVQALEATVPWLELAHKRVLDGTRRNSAALCVLKRRRKPFKGPSSKKLSGNTGLLFWWEPPSSRELPGKLGQ